MGRAPWGNIGTNRPSAEAPLLKGVCEMDIRTNRLAVTSFADTMWVELASDEDLRDKLGTLLRKDNKEGNDQLLRQLFPLKARLIRESITLRMKKGDVLKYARVRRTPARYPIEVFFSARPDGRGALETRRIGMDST